MVADNLVYKRQAYPMTGSTDIAPPVKWFRDMSKIFLGNTYSPVGEYN